MFICLCPKPGRTAEPRQNGPFGLGLKQYLAAALLFAVSAEFAQAVTVAWDPSPGSDIAGYRVYQGVASRTYTKTNDVGKATTQTVSNLAEGVTYYFAITAYAANGLESDYSSEVVYTVPQSPSVAQPVWSGTRLTLAADSGNIKAPFVAANGILSQSVETSVANGGRVAYSFTILNAGNYLVSALVSAPNDGANSFYVNIDAEPTDPLMVWDIPVCQQLTSHTVAWRGNGSPDPASSQYSPKVFNLSAGTHQLIICGREAYTQLGAITITAAPPTLEIRSAPGKPAILRGTGQAGQKYNILCSQNLTTWTPIGTASTDASGSFTFVDPAGSSRRSCLYRLQCVAVQPSKLKIRASAGEPAVLSGTGQAGQTYIVLRSQNCKVWTAIGSVTIDATGSFAFTDSTANSLPSAVYRLQGQ